MGSVIHKELCYKVEKLKYKKLLLVINFLLLKREAH